MVDSVSGGRPQTPVEAFQEQQKAGQAEKIDKIGLSYDNGNSVSHLDAKGENPLASSIIHAPVIPEPDSATTATGDKLSDVHTQTLLHKVRSGVNSIVNFLKHDQPEMITPAISEKASEINAGLGKVSSAPVPLMKELAAKVDSLHNGLDSGTLDSDQLDQIMSEIRSKMDDNSIKYSEFDIKLRSANAQQKHDSNIEKIENHIKEAEKAKQESSSGGWFKSFITAIFPPLALFEAGVQIAEEITGSESSLSMFSKNNAFGKVLDEAEKDIEKTFTDFGIDIKEAFEPIGKKEAWDNLGKDLDRDLGRLGRDTEQAFSKAGNEVADAFKPIGNKQAWDNLGDDLNRDLGKLGKDTEQAFSKAGNEVADAFEPIGNKQAWDNLGDDLNRDLGKLGRDTEQAFSKAGNEIADAYKPIGQKETWDNTGDEILTDLGIEPSSGKTIESASVETKEEGSFAVEQEKAKIEKELSAATLELDNEREVFTALQGLDVGESAMTSQEMMKLLQQMKIAEENKEKLEEAIAALESGDLESLKQIATELSGGDAIIALMDNPEASAAKLTGSLLDVPAETIKMQEDQMLQNSMTKRFS
ncbi:hypothetical protein NX722_19770 [Endozoicomonas gorgoniicola]|uniref:Uncharacterized protein n=1 Tax=Endozoicomonas gorgoniicola TaxID=1234144 RepID=A0ABT3MZM7_9GAMM|nr:hypothetical protein [Endozoicomonas gorgoniicola]MCW7554817.1 hypothetical protein [Endozoicomonas gorgoniicola]